MIPTISSHHHHHRSDELEGESPSRSRVSYSPRRGRPFPPSRLGRVPLRSLGRTRNAAAIVALVGLALLCVNAWMFSGLQGRAGREVKGKSHSVQPAPPLVGQSKPAKSRIQTKFLNARLLALAAHALAEGDKKSEPPELWREPLDAATSWVPCSGKYKSKASDGRAYGYLLVSANGGINQQRVAICNAVAVARLLNASLVVPYFQFNSVWKDMSLVIYIKRNTLSTT